MSLPNEQWKQIEGFEGRYEVSDQGRVRSFLAYRGVPGPRILKGCADRRGYLTVNLFDADAVMHLLRIHWLVAKTFVGPRPDGMQIRHLDGVRTNNVASNLCYGSPSENILDQVGHGTHAHASKTSCPQGHPYDEANTYYAKKTGNRKCRACSSERQRRLWQEQERVTCECGSVLAACNMRQHLLTRVHIEGIAGWRERAATGAASLEAPFEQLELA